MYWNRKKASVFVSVLVTAAMSVATVSYAGDIVTNNPIVINKSGSYRLQGNIIVQHPGVAVEIAAPNVTLDLNGYSVLGSGSGSGIVAMAPDTTIMNGSVADMSGTGVDCFDSCRIEKMRITRCGVGIAAGFNSLIKDNVIVFNSSHGLVFPPLDPFPGGPGLSGFSNNVINDNNGGNTNIQIEGYAIELGTNICGNTTDCSPGSIVPAASGTTINDSADKQDG
ncbi:MAG: hypothetical protein U9Q81_01770 [Pseudomonadota bacterium]|nr:hypothetical protein [Pseudomonadota bacterium]